MSTITGASFVKSGADNNVVLLGAGGTKPISEFTTTINDSNYVKKGGEVQQDIQGILRKTILDQPYPEPTDDDYITLGALKNEFVSSIYSDSINGNLTANQFIKSSGTDQQVLLANGTTKAISEFANGSVDDSNYVKKSGQTIQVIKGYIRKNMDDVEEEVSEDDEDYMTRGEIATQYVGKWNDQQIVGTKSFTQPITANGFIKSVGTNQQVLMANGSTKPLAEFSGGGGDMTNYVQKIGQTLQVVNGKLRKGDGEEESESEEEDYMIKGEYNNNTNQIINNYCVRKSGQNFQTVTGRLLYINPFGLENDDSKDLTDTTYPTWREVSNAVTSKFYNFYQELTPPVMNAAFTASQSINPPPLYILFRYLNNDYFAMFTDDGTVYFTTQATLKQTSLLLLFLNYEMSYEIGSVYLDEALLEAAGQLEFPQYYAYIIERDQEPVPPAQRIPIGEQTLQNQVKDNDDILFSTNEEFTPPVSNAPIKLELSSQLERSSFLASSGSDPQLIVYGDCVTLTASYETTGLFPNGYLFKSYPEFARPKAGDKVIILVGTNTTNKNSIFCYIDQNGPFIISTSQIPSKTGTFETSSHVYETVKKQTDMIATGLFGDNKVNYLNSDIKLQGELAIYKADRAAFFIKEGPFITFSFGAKLGQIIQQSNSENRQTVHRLFSTITQKLLPPKTKYMPVLTEQQEYTAMCLFKDIYDKSLAVEVAVSGILNNYDCEFQETYILDNYKNPTLNEEPNASPIDPKEHDSHIDEVIIKHDGKLVSSPLSIYTITNVFNQIQLIAPFDHGGHAYNTYYIVDDGTCKVCVFNLYFETK
ncbi:MAG: hypothetical protein EZS28_013244 [Streblomastix strix]|uniref:Uncharacterized protein n=1 Tax=Streblomastix strix TaxID=222440 RepID=A0A5J4WA24_9EUKA|nr:MAG: hypothetical protein EZS28_013244 [Streblomastix strix]